MPMIDAADSLQPMREVLRIVEGISGEVELAVEVEPRPRYASTAPRLERRGRLGWAYSWSNELLFIVASQRLEPTEQRLESKVTVRAGQRFYLSLSYVLGDIAVIPSLDGGSDARLESTIGWWQAWTDHCSYQGPYRDAVERSALTLKLLTFSLSGAIVAAPTTSLPEAIGGERNWDYRYCWLRDAGLTIGALIGLGFHEEARCFLSWLLHATRLTWPELRVVYDVYGRASLQERELKHLDGYRGSRPVRVGNDACSQLQLDVYGQVILAADHVVSAGVELDAAELRLLSGLAKIVAKQWRKADHGIWEIREPRRQYTFSKLMCWTALDRLLRLHERGDIDLKDKAERFRQEREGIRATIEKQGFNRALGSYTSELDGDKADAAMLLMACLGFRDAADPRVVTTYHLIRNRLAHRGLLRRYEKGNDDLAGEEGTFAVCSFWAVEQLALRNELDAAVQLFEHLLSFANDIGLFAEEIDPDSGAALGNFPQAFTHVGLVNAALAIERARQNG